jgi:hypothetical protein
MTEPTLDRKGQIAPLIQDICIRAGVSVEFLEPRRTTDIFILMVRGEREKVVQAHTRMSEQLQGEDVAVVAERDRSRGYVLSLVVMEKPEEQSPQMLERRGKLQEIYKIE